MSKTSVASSHVPVLRESVTPADAGGRVQRFRCIYCIPPHEFVSEVPVCPKCGTGERKQSQPFIVPLVTTHFDPHPVIRREGQHVMACTGKSWPAGILVSGETAVVTCPACRETDAFKAAEAKQHSPDAAEQKRKQVDVLVSKLYVDRPRDLDPALAEAFFAVALAIRECTRLRASIPYLWTDEGEYRRLAACVADAATAARNAYKYVDIRLRRAGGPNPMLEALNFVLSVQGRAPLDPTGTPGGLKAILMNLSTYRPKFFAKVDGRGFINRMLDQLALVPPATNSAPADTDPRPAVSAPLTNETQQSEGEKPPADPFRDLRQFARSDLKGQERAVIDALCDAGGELPIADLAVTDGVGWNDPFQRFKDAQRRLNPKLKPKHWRLQRRNNAGFLVTF